MNDAWSSAVYLLSRREHGEQELLDKLIAKGYASVEAEAALAKCKNLQLQSDARFAETLCRARIRQGYGPLRIRQELVSKGVDRQWIEAALEAVETDWLTHGMAVWRKKNNMNKQTPDFAALQKMQRFLLYKGFPAGLVAEIARMCKEELVEE